MEEQGWPQMIRSRSHFSEAGPIDTIERGGADDIWPCAGGPPPYRFECRSQTGPRVCECQESE